MIAVDIWPQSVRSCRPMSTDPSSRMLRLLSLLQTHRFWPGAELADRLEVSQRTLRRDIDRLRELGYLVDATRGAAGGYRLTGNRRRTTLMDIVALFEPAPGSRPQEPGEQTDIGGALLRVLTEIDEIAEATLRSISLETMLKPLQAPANEPGRPV